MNEQIPSIQNHSYILFEKFDKILIRFYLLLKEKHLITYRSL